MVQYVDVSAWINSLNANVGQVVRKTIIDIDSEVSVRSPVYTGRFKANWMLGINQQPVGFDKEKKDGTPNGSVGTVVSEHAASIPAKAAGPIYYLVNNLPYANALENGHSAQTGRHPHGIVGLTVLAFEAMVKKHMDAIK